MKAISLGLALLVASACAYTAPIKVKDVKGREMEVEVVAFTESSGNVRIKRTDGQFFNVKLDVFDPPSQELIRANAPKAKAELAVKVSVGKRRSRQEDSSYMKNQTISASVAVENQSRDIDFGKGKGTLFLVARQTARYANREEDYGKVLSKQSFDVAAKAGEDYTYEAKPVVTSYDSDRDSSNVGGWEYYGYLFVLQDEDGVIHTVETSIGNLKKDVEIDPGLGKKLLALSKDSLVEKNLEKK